MFVGRYGTRQSLPWSSPAPSEQMGVVRRRYDLEPQCVDVLVQVTQLAIERLFPSGACRPDRAFGQERVIDLLARVGNQGCGQTRAGGRELEAMVPKVEPTVVLELEWCCRTLHRRPLAQPLQTCVDLEVAGRTGKPCFTPTPGGREIDGFLDQPETRDAKVEVLLGPVGVTRPLENGYAVVRTEEGDQLPLVRIGRLRAEPHAIWAGTTGRARVGCDRARFWRVTLLP